MTEYEDQNGAKIRGKEMYGKFKAGVWDGERRDDGCWVISDEEGNERVFEAVQVSDGPPRE